MTWLASKDLELSTVACHPMSSVPASPAQHICPVPHTYSHVTILHGNRQQTTLYQLKGYGDSAAAALGSNSVVLLP